MARKKGTYKNLSLMLTPGQYEALEVEAERQELKISELVRSIFSENVPNFAEAKTVPHHGFYERSVEDIVAAADKLTDYGRNDPTAE